MSVTATANKPTGSSETGELGYELGRYTVAAGERVLCGQRVNGVAIVIDAPAGSDGRVYLVERDVDHDGYRALQALIADYLATAKVTGRIPMQKRDAQAPRRSRRRGA